jgi:hypothetical protein
LFVELVSAELPAGTLVVAVDPGKVSNRVLLASGERGLIGEPVSLPVQREGIDRLCRLIEAAGADQTVIALEATGSLHVPWATELERRFKDDDRDCAALVSLARQGRGRSHRPGSPRGALGRGPPLARDLPPGAGRAARARDAADRGPRRAGPQRLPPLPLDASKTGTVRREALRSGPAARAVTALLLCRSMAQPGLPPARVGLSHGAKKNLPHDGA